MIPHKTIDEIKARIIIRRPKQAPKMNKILAESWKLS